MKHLAILLACLAACAGSQAHPDTLARLKVLAAAPCSADQQCRTLPVGAKSCGGPESYLAYSTTRTPPEKAAQLAQRYRDEREAENKASGRVSDCRFLADPGAQCRAGVCRLRGAAEPAVE